MADGRSSELTPGLSRSTVGVPSAGRSRTGNVTSTGGSADGCTTSCSGRSASVAERLDHVGAEVGVDLAPVLADTRRHVGLEAGTVAGVTDDVGQQVVAVGLGHHLAVHRAGLDEVGVVAMGVVCGPDDLSRELVG